MLIDTTLLVNDSAIIQGLLNGSLKRFGGVIRDAATGRIVRHLLEPLSLTKKLADIPLPPMFGGASSKLNPFPQILSSALQLNQIAAAASVLNLGVSIAGFAYMGYKLNQIQNALDNVQKSLEAGFNRLEEQLENLSGQLAYLHLLVEHNRQEQQRISQAISELHRAILIKEIANLRAVILDRSRYPNSPARHALKVASRVRMVLSDQAIQPVPNLDAQTMLIVDVAVQGWAVATATEAYLLLEIGQIEEARQLLALEVSRFKDIAVQWADVLLANERSQLATTYRFATPRFQEHVSQERIERISYISSVDKLLSKDQIRRKKKDAELEFEMSYSSLLDEKWTHQQIAVAEYLDAFSELSARLESLQAFADLCHRSNVKSSRGILPRENTESGLYTLKASEQ
ncbi:hypothetical protein F7734_48285 [Scytonema sp. UIC 10036]|uniref:hypothetical protein n=1 Tax=Scytonema sp. UIC 10036 TaxID=2304196 RepID=UPI0012DA710E|nr:hypothetical protein [Scytonema sp. UIC 10036]MUG99670.1 hypothetical protein [Scytonema sp. UIC 10036]